MMVKSPLNAWELSTFTGSSTDTAFILDGKIYVSRGSRWDDFYRYDDMLEQVKNGKNSSVSPGVDHLFMVKTDHITSPNMDNRSSNFVL